jgi:hypothetical protein
MKVSRLIATIFALLISKQIRAQACEKWFSQANIKSGPTCLTSCALIPIDMSNFECPSKCPELCKSGQAESFVFKLTELYPGLTASERALAAKEPTKMLKSYQLSHTAEGICKQKFPTSATNDESDACRHFVWAGLLTHAFGRAFAEEVLFAHEQEPTQPGEERAMDLANNQRGISLTEELLKAGSSHMMCF